MNTLLSFGLLAFVLTFCGITEQIKKLQSFGDKSSNSSSKPDSKPDSSDSNAEEATLTPAQQAIIDNATETEWEAQGVTFQLPAGWSKLAEEKTMFNYGAPDKGFVIAAVSVMGDDFPSDISLKAFYDQAMQKMKNGDAQSARYLTIDGITGVEWVESPPSSKEDPRRHQWLAYRRYLGQNQMITVMTSADAGKWSGKEDTFSAILYSMKFTQ